MNVFKLSRLYQPKLTLPPGKERASYVSSKSQKVLEQFGLVSQGLPGVFTLMPIALRVLEKLKRVIIEEIESIGAQQILMPALLAEETFKVTGRSELPELFKVRDRHGKTIILGPTHEEAVVSHVASARLTYKQLPLLLYQISPKFRDEIKPRFGLLRSREFLMKDMYCFSSSPECGLSVYNLVNKCYHNIFKRLDLPYCCVNGSNGEIGGSLSHEFHVLTDIGEDKLEICNSCGNGKNLETQDFNSSGTCAVCLKKTSIRNGIEVGHSFLLGTRYTKPLNCRFMSRENDWDPAEMSCHGIGLSRLLAAAVEALSSNSCIRWPDAIMPFHAVFIPPKAGSKEEQLNCINIDEIARKCGCDVLIDDRTELTIGKRLLEAQAMGYSLVIVFGKSMARSSPQVEVFAKNCSELVEIGVLPSFLMSKLQHGH